MIESPPISNQPEMNRVLPPEGSLPDKQELEISAASPSRRWAWLVSGAVLSLLAGLLVAFVAVPTPQIGIVRFEDMIWYYSSEYMSEWLDYARTNNRIRAVVLQIDSPGGEVIYTEELYFRLLELRKVKPLIVSVDSMAASGGYYMAVAGDYIFAKPASIVGNIGVISMLPTTEEQRFTDESQISTGPFKFSGGSRGDYLRQIELLKLGFLEAVFSQRGDKLQTDRVALSSGEIFLGLQAKKLGLVDELGATTEAIQKAAEMAHIAHYQVVNVAEQVYEQEAASEEEAVAPVEDAQPTAVQATATPPTTAHSKKMEELSPGLYYLYVEPAQRRP